MRSPSGSPRPPRLPDKRPAGLFRRSCGRRIRSAQGARGSKGLHDGRAGRTAHARKIRAHPHGRGECGGISIWGLVIFGSSPRTWGMPPLCQRSFRKRRFIPTGGGECEAVRDGLTANGGSSPRAAKRRPASSPPRKIGCARSCGPPFPSRGARRVSRGVWLCGRCCRIF